MNIEEFSEKLVSQLCTEIDPVLKRACKKSKNFPCYAGLFFNTSLPIYEKDGNLWYGIFVDMRWSPPPPANYALLNLFRLYLPMDSEKVLFWSTNRTRLNHGNIDTFVKLKIGNFMNLLASEQNWSITHDFKIVLRNKVLSTKESRSLIQNKKIKTSLLL